MDVKKLLIAFINKMNDWQVQYAYTFLTEMFGKKA